VSSDGKQLLGKGGGPFRKGADPRRNAGGRPSIVNDLRAAGAIDPSLPTTPAEARAKWWAMILPVAFAGPQGPRDSNWIYAAGEAGVRLLGKPKETVVIEGSEESPVDWSKVPEDRREKLLEALTEIELIVAPVDEPVEH